MWVIALVKLGGTAPWNLGRQENVQNLVQFWTIFKFDCKYLWNGQRYWQAVNGVINHSSWGVEEKTDELGSTDKKSHRRTCWPPTLNRKCVICVCWGIWVRAVLGYGVHMQFLHPGPGLVYAAALRQCGKVGGGHEVATDGGDYICSMFLVLFLNFPKRMWIFGLIMFYWGGF